VRRAAAEREDRDLLEHPAEGGGGELAEDELEGGLVRRADLLVRDRLLLHLRAEH
jgi:hypothetical protein